MKGIELAKAYYEAYGRSMLESFPEVLPYVAAGVAGSGSEWLGFDDETSTDHDFGPGFMIFLPGEELVSRRQEFLLERAYAALPSEFQGFRREKLSPVGGNRFGVRRMADFFRSTVGEENGRLTEEEFLRIPEQYLVEATNGAVFYDGSGAFTKVREALAVLPDDVRLKKLAGEFVRLGQAAPYNFERCLSHGETGAAELSLVEFTEASMHVAFLLSRRYMPYYKWRFRAAASLPETGSGFSFRAMTEALEYLITHENSGEVLKEKRKIVEDVTDGLLQTAVQVLTSEGYLLLGENRAHAASNPYRMSGVLSENGRPEETASVRDPGKLAEIVNGLIGNSALRSLHILSGV